MDVKTEKKQSCVLELDINVPHSEMQTSEEEAITHLQSQTVLPGFRRGKAPRDLILNRHKEDVKKSILQQMLWSKLSEHIQNEKLKVISDPYVREVNYNLGEDLNFKATLELEPEFDIIEYNNIPVEIEKNDVTAEEEEKAFEDLQQKYSQFSSSEDGIIKKENFAVIDYKLSVDDKQLEEKSATWVKITDEAYLKNFTDQLIGMKIGEEKQIMANLPDNYAQKDYAGKQGLFQVKIIDVKQRIKPELNDDFAKTVGPFETLDALKEAIKKNLKEHKENQSRLTIENQVCDYLLKYSSMELPPTMLLREEQAFIRDAIQRLHYSGLKEEDLKKRLPDIQKEAKEKSREHLIIHFLLERIIENENMDVTEEDLEKEYKRMSLTFRMPVEKLKEKYSGDDEKEGLRSRIRKIKAIDFLINNANIKEK